MKDIRENLKIVIEQSGMKQVAIAHKANIHPSKLSEILNKRRRLDANELFDICHALGTTPNAVYHIDSNQQSA